MCCLNYYKKFLHCYDCVVSNRNCNLQALNIITCTESEDSLVKSFGNNLSSLEIPCHTIDSRISRGKDVPSQTLQKKYIR